MRARSDIFRVVGRQVRRWVVLHPFLFGAFPIVYLFAQNLNEQVTPGLIVRPLVMTLGAVALLLLVGVLIFRDPKRVGLVVSVWTLLFFSYGYVWGVETAEGLEGSRIDNTLPILVWMTLGAAAILFAVFAKRILARLTTWLNIVAGLLLLVNLVPIVAYRPADVPEPPKAFGEASGVPLGGTRPDIYYLVFDRYARQDTLAETFRFDNSPFLDQLTRRGFVVGTESRSNYPKTSHSLASSLNMQFLDFLTGRVEGSSVGPAQHLVSENDVAEFLKSQGYRYVVVSSGWGPTSGGPLADTVWEYESASEFSSALFDTTILEGLGEDLGELSRRVDRRTSRWHRVLYQFDRLAKSQQLRGPKFVVAHFLLPHRPYVFDRNGRFVSEEEEARRDWKALYVEQLQFANTRIMHLVDRLLSGPRSSHPIIILQADEGPHPEELLEEQEDFSWSIASDEQLALKFPILNAYYLPGAGRDRLYPSITPVNSFRLILSAYFGLDLPLLPDRSYIFKDYQHLYDFVDVTSRLTQ